MHTEYQIDIEYVDGTKVEHLTYRFESEQLRNDVYNLVCAKFSNDRVDIEQLRENGGVTVSTYNYKEPVINEIAQFVPNSSFSIEVLNAVLEEVKSKAINW